MLKKILKVTFFSLLIFLSSCGSDSMNPDAPKILSFEVLSMSSSDGYQFYFSLEFSDKNSDLDQGEIFINNELLSADDNSQSGGWKQILQQNFHGQEIPSKAKVVFALNTSKYALNLKKGDKIGISAQLKDAAGHRSNKASITLMLKSL